MSPRKVVKTKIEANPDDEIKKKAEEENKKRPKKVKTKIAT